MPVAHLQRDSQGRIDSITWLTTDHLGTPRLGTNNTSQTVWRWTGDAFGTVQPNSDPDSNGTHIHIENRFAGQYRDNETGLHYNGFRHYSPIIGRYMSSDPIGLAGGMNTYGYVTGNPLANFDLFGLTDQDAGSLPGSAGAFSGIPRAGPARTRGGASSSFADFAENVALDAAGATYDFADAYADMMMARYWHGLSHRGWANQDHYFHCRANCRAAQRGVFGAVAARCLSYQREENFDGSSNDTSPEQKRLEKRADYKANQFGRTMGSNNPDTDCRQLCDSYRPGGSFPQSY